MKKLYLGLFSFIFLLNACSESSSKIGKDSQYEGQIDSLLSIMTLDEKIGQMTLYTSNKDQTGAFIRPEYKKEIQSGNVGAIFNAYGSEYTRSLQEMAVNETRLGIPLLFGYDVIHGHRTIFPVPIAEASSWDLNMIQTSAEVAAREASSEGLHWTFAPMVDIARDPRWGRVVEGSGEDTYLGSVIAAARVRGFQGDDLSDLHTLAATAKHFAAYGAAKAGRDYHTVDMSERELREVYLPPFKASLNAGAVSVMSAFNTLNGIPATANKFLFTDILRDEWDFKGFVVTDYTAIMELLYHGVAGDEKEASKLALDAGVDMDMQDGFFQQTLADLVEEGKVKETQIDKAVRNILRVKFQLGLFEDPYRYSSTERQEAEIMKPENIEAAREMAQRSMVLLKNENETLPIKKSTKTIAIIGPMGDNQRDLIGSWSAAGDWSKSVTLLQGLKNKLPDANIIYAKGAEVDGDSKVMFAEAVRVARRAEVVILALGEAYWMSGEAASKVNIGLPGVQQELAKEIQKLNKPTVAVLMNGRPMTINWLDENIPAILETWFLGTTTGDAIADVLVGDYNPSGKLPITFPKHVGQIPIHYNMKNTGRPIESDNKYLSRYLDISNEPLYPFGYGLSYTEFDYSPIVLSSKTMTNSDSIKVSVKVSNTGNYQGEEVVQLYIKDKVASVSRPIKELKAFKKIQLKVGETQTVEFTITNKELSFYRLDMSFGSEPGDFMIFIGGNSVDNQSAEFVLDE